MNGPHTFEELTAHFTADDWERVADMDAEHDATMPPDEPCAVASLRTMRELEDAPLAEYAAELGTDEAGALAFEEGDDAPVSQVAAYIKAMGGRLKVVAEFPDGDDVIIANFYRKRRWPARSDRSMFGRFELIPNTAAGPATYRQIEWAAQTCRRRQDGRYDDAARRQVYAPRFRAALRNGCDGAVIEQMLGFIKGEWDMGAGDAAPGKAVAEALRASVPDAIATLRHLADADLRDVDGDGMSAWDSILARRAVERLMADEGVDVVLASQILGLANPALFVAWDTAAQREFFPHNDPDDGFAPVRYVRFVWKMADAARAVRQDAAVNHGIDDPAAHLSKELGIDPPITLAGFISEYNRLTLAAGRQPEQACQPAVGNE